MDKRKYYRTFEILFGAIFVLQFLMLMYINITQLDKHMGYDASSGFLNIMEMWKEKTIFLQNMEGQTVSVMDGIAQFLILPLYGILGNVFVAYGIVNNICIAVGCFLFTQIGKHLNLNRLSLFVCLNLFLCPHFCSQVNNANDLGYFPMILTSHAPYVTKMFVVLLLILSMMNLLAKKKDKLSIVILVITGILCFIMGMGSGYFILAVGVAPCLLFILVRFFVYDDYKKILTPETAYLFLCTFLTAAGKFCTSHILKIETKDSTMEWIGLTDFWENLGAIVTGYMKLLHTLPMESNMGIFSIEGISHLFTVSLFVLLITAMAGILIWMIKDRDRKIGGGGAEIK